MSIRFATSIFLLLLVCGCLPVKGQECQPPLISANSKANNLFSAEQETILGELTKERMSGELRFIRDPQLVSYVNRIDGKKLFVLGSDQTAYAFDLEKLKPNSGLDASVGKVTSNQYCVAADNHLGSLPLSARA